MALRRSGVRSPSAPPLRRTRVLIAQRRILALALFEPGRLPQPHIANAMIEADPVDAVSAAAGIAVAQLYPPLGRPRLRYESERLVHCSALLLHAARLPLAVHADVERDGIVQHRHSRRACR